MKFPAILIVEDDPAMNALLSQYLASHFNSEVKGYNSGEELMAEIDKYKNPIVIQDFDLPGINGLEVIRLVKSKKPGVDFIFLSGQGSIEIALEALRKGAFDYLVKDNFAKENTITKLNYLIRMRMLKAAQKRNRLISTILIVSSVVVWLIFLTKYFLTDS